MLAYFIKFRHAPNTSKIKLWVGPVVVVDEAGLVSTVITPSEMLH